MKPLLYPHQAKLRVSKAFFCAQFEMQTCIFAFVFRFIVVVVVD